MKECLKFSSLKIPLIMAGFFWALAIVLWQSTGDIFFIPTLS